MENIKEEEIVEIGEDKGEEVRDVIEMVVDKPVDNSFVGFAVDPAEDDNVCISCQ